MGTGISYNEALEGARFFISNANVLKIVGLYGIIAFISIIIQCCKAFGNASNDKNMEQIKKNIITILVCFAMAVCVTFIIKGAFNLVNKPSHYNIPSDVVEKYLK